MYRVIQFYGDFKNPQNPTIWCTTDDFNFLCKFCQYQIDSAIPDGLETFWIIHTEEQDENGIEKLIKKCNFLEFCKEQGIRRRTFEERMKNA